MRTRNALWYTMAVWARGEKYFKNKTQLCSGNITKINYNKK